MRSFFTTRQWQWIGERFREGYSLETLAVFLGVHRETVRRGLIRIGIKPRNKQVLSSLARRKQDFLLLGQEGTQNQAQVADATQMGGTCDLF